jgi:3-oxoadipate enol-lactonase
VGSSSSKRPLETDRISTEILESGAGGRPLLILHGFCGAKESFEEVLRPLADDGWHVVAFDQRGHGSADHPAGRSSYSFGEFVEDALALADALGWSRFVLLGHSMGGMTAQRLAGRAQGRLDGLVLEDTAGRAPQIEPELVAAGRSLVETEGLPALVELMRDMGGILDTPAHKRLLVERAGYQEELDAQTLACSAEMWLAMSKAMFEEPDTTESLTSLEVPALVVVGEQDDAFLEGSVRLADAIPRARLSVIADAGHSPHLEATEAFLEHLGSFLDGLGRRD